MDLFIIPTPTQYDLRRPVITAMASTRARASSLGVSAVGAPGKKTVNKSKLAVPNFSHECVKKIADYRARMPGNVCVSSSALWGYITASGLHEGKIEINKIRANKFNLSRFSANIGGTDITIGLPKQTAEQDKYLIKKVKNPNTNVLLCLDPANVEVFLKDDKLVPYFKSASYQDVPQSPTQSVLTSVVQPDEMKVDEEEGGEAKSD